MRLLQNMELQSLDIYLGTEFIQSMKKAICRQWLYLTFLYYLWKWLMAIFVNCWFIIGNTLEYVAGSSLADTRW
jgi:hypothetical protein